jgi:hypothetical protein
VSEDGKFSLALLPGTYKVYAVPGASSVTGESGSVVRMGAASQTDWEIAAEPVLQAGKLVELTPVRHLTGAAFEPGTGEPAVGSIVTAIASPRSVQVDLLTQAALGSLAFAPSAQNATVDSQGRFDVQADPGVFDISVRPPEASGFPWYVASNVVVPPAPPGNAALDLGSPILPLPVPYRGQVSVPLAENMTRPVAEALLRAYVYLDEDGKYTGDPTRAVSVVQVGETRADELGNFELLIPAYLN